MPVKKPETENNAMIADLKQRIIDLNKEAKQRTDELMERIRIARTGDVKRSNLLRHCERYEYSRADLRWVITNLPMERVSAKHRLTTRKLGTQNKTKVLHPRFAVVIDKAMRAKALTPDQVADKVKVHVSSVHNWMRGTSFPIKQGVVPKLMEVLDLPEAAFKKG